MLDPGQVLQIIGVLLSGLGGLLGNVALVMITTIFMLLEAADLPIKLRAAIGDIPRVAHFNEIQRAMRLNSFT